MEPHKWQQTLLPTNATLQEAIRNLDESALQIVLVVSEDGILQGTLTDGDIRRGLLRGCDLETPINEIMFHSPLVAPPEMGREMVLHLMRANKLLQLPVVDAEHRVIGLHLWNEVITPASRPNLVVIMAGGLGTRLLPYTEDCPKPMLLVSGKPMLEHIIERARSEGFSHFVLAVRYLKQIVEQYFGDGERWGVHIDYIREEIPLGTVGALSLLDSAPNYPIVVTNGDVLTDIHFGDLLDFHEKHQADATMAVRQHEWQHPFGVVRIQGIDMVGISQGAFFSKAFNAEGWSA